MNEIVGTNEAEEAPTIESIEPPPLPLQSSAPDAAAAYSPPTGESSPHPAAPIPPLPAHIAVLIQLTHSGPPFLCIIELTEYRRARTILSVPGNRFVETFFYRDGSWRKHEIFSIRHLTFNLTNDH